MSVDCELMISLAYRTEELFGEEGDLSVPLSMQDGLDGLRSRHSMLTQWQGSYAGNGLFGAEPVVVGVQRQDSDEGCD